MKRLVHLGLAVLACLSSSAAFAQDEAAERIMRGYVRAMAVIEECRLDVPQPVFLRLLDYGKGLESRLGLSDDVVVRLSEEEKAAFDVETSSCDIDDDVVAGVLGFVQEQSVIVGMNSGLGVRDVDSINVLGGLFVLVATAERCEVPLSADVAGAIGAHAGELQEILGMSDERAEQAYQGVLGGLRAQEVDCGEGSEARAAIDGLIANYSTP